MIDIYIASPYSHPEPEVREQRFHDVCKYAGHLMRKGLTVFSPIAHSHPIAMECGLPKGFDYWKEHDRQFLEWSNAMHVLQLDGWQDSAGILEEIEIAESLGMQITMIEWDEGWNT